ncbi:acyl-CoA thioesterase [Novosphingobium sp. 1949]|uniref:Acyl-CoA thioesterase n=1 Tax=Novosphingobium organovorum TaxID=2930092 RepID=A0ABT0B8S2_9SPHN|nr:hotdog domain-containing protein [Novosphingobium organovorum]MCJ2181248.1 acyl-CoA thioesterase [Novosphingobium organovorum]
MTLTAPLDRPSTDSSVQLIDMIFPGDTNHHGTLFGGVALAHMDKIAFLAATRHGRAPFVTACSQRIDFEAPGYTGDMVEVSGAITRVGTSSLDVEVTVTAEAPVSGERRRLTRGLFTMVARKGPETRLPLPPLEPASPADDADRPLRMVEIVFPTSTNHHGTLFGGDAMKLMSKAAFIAATRHAREIVVMASSSRVDFASPIKAGAMVELLPRVRMTGRSSLLVEVEMWSEELLTGARNHAATARYTMVAVDAEGKPKPFAKAAL